MVHTSIYFSIIIPTLNEQNYIGNLLNDLTLQTYKDFEVIIVDGKSKDDTKKIVDKFRKDNSWIKYLESNS